MRAAALLVLLALLVAGCGTGSEDSAKDFKGQQKAVATAVEDLETAARDDKPAKICDQLLAQSLLAGLKQVGTNCRTAVKQGLKDVDTFDLKVDSIKLAGTKASAKVTSGTGSDKKHETMLFEREGSAWKIATLGSGS